MDNRLHKAESFLTSRDILNQSNSLHLVEPETSLPCLQRSIISIYSKPDNSSHAFPSYFLRIILNTIFPPTTNLPNWIFPFKFLYQYALCTFFFPHTPRLCRQPSCYHLKNIWRDVEIMKFFIMIFPPVSTFLVSVRYFVERN